MTEDLFEIDPTSSRPRRVAGRLGVWLGLAVMLGLGGLAVWAISDGEPQLGTGDPDDGTTLAVEFGGPYNGFESIGYPVTVVPSLDLVDRQVVVVTASQFPPNRPLAVVQ